MLGQNDLSIRELAEQISDVVGYTGQIKWDISKPDGTPKKQLDVADFKIWAGILLFL